MKGTVYASCVRNVRLYGSETQAVKDHDVKSSEHTEMVKRSEHTEMFRDLSILK